MTQEHFIDLCRLLDHPTPACSRATGGSPWNKRTLTNLFNARPTWLNNAHHKLDAAVFAAYGWPADPSTGSGPAPFGELVEPTTGAAHDLPDEEILARLLALNLARAGGELDRQSSAERDRWLCGRLWYNSHQSINRCNH